MQLFHSATSPFVRKVLVLLIETDQQQDVTIVPASGHPLDSAHMPLAQNPLGKIPALMRDDGPALYDSRVICRYLDDRAGGKLYPQSRLYETLTLEATADGIMEAAVLMRYEQSIRPEELRWDDWTEAQWAKIERALDVLNTRWMSHLNGPLDMGQIAVGCALAYLDLRHGARDWRATRDSLAKWAEDFAGRPAMQATQPEG